MKAIYFNQFGGPEQIKIGDQPTPEPKENEILIKINHTSANPVDWKIREGHLAEMLPHVFPIIPGWDAAGTVVSTGSSNSAFKAGDSVYAYARKPEVQNGTYAEYISLPDNFVAHAPKNLSSAEAASVPLVGLTAYQVLTKLIKIKAGETVYITSGSGGVGSLAIQIAKVLGAFVITSGSSKKLDYLKQLGADLVIDYGNDDILQKIKEIKPEGVDAVFDTFGGKTLEQSYKALKKNGRLVSIVETPDETIAAELQAEFSFHFVEPSGTELAELAKMFEDGKIKIFQLEVRNIKEAAEIQILSQKGRTLGKIVLENKF